MPIGSFDLSYVPTAVANQALPIAVCVYSAGDATPYTILPNVRCSRIDYREGPEPSAARFEYLTGDLLAFALGWPSQFEDLWPISTPSMYAVDVDTRLVVLTSDPGGNPVVLWDGFAQIPQVDVDARNQTVTFVGVGVAARLWDTPISGRLQRDGGFASTVDSSHDVLVDAPARFNPANDSVGSLGGFIGNAVSRANATVFGAESYQVFIDPLLFELNNNSTAYWTTKDVLCYLLATQPNPVDTALNPYVVFPSLTTLSALLTTWIVLPGSPLGPGFASPSHIHVRDYDASNKPVPEVFADLLGYFGLILNFATNQTAAGLPITNLQILRRDSFAAQKPKPIFLANSGPAIGGLTPNNTTALHLARDTNVVNNSWEVETQLRQVETTLYLAPLFTPTAGDELTPANFFSSNLTNSTSTLRRRYRWYGVDECGEGHWNSSIGGASTRPMDFSPIFPPTPGGTPTYVQRFRAAQRKLVSIDAERKPLKAILEIQRPALNGDPAILKAAAAGGGWQIVTHGWQLLDDRLGIEVSVENPEEWHTGNVAIPTIMGISWQSAPAAGVDPFRLRLTVVVESDQRLDINAPRRFASPTQFIRERSADGKDHFQHCSIALGSLNYVAQGGNGTDPKVLRDDTTAATTHAVQLRSAHEFPVLAGSVTLPFITDFYQIGDQINVVSGRDASLQINVGAALGEAPCYPWVTAFSWVLEPDRQETVLQLSDRRAEPQRIT